MDNNSMQDKKDVGALLRAPFPAKLVSWRLGKTSADGSRGQALPYISPRAVQDRLDEVLGPDGWSNSFAAMPLGDSSSVIATISLKLDGQWVSKSDAAQLDALSEEANREIAIKGVYSDSFKRAAVMWGIGRYLYAFDAPWVDVRDHRLAETPKLPPHMLPENERAAAEAKAADAKANKGDKVADKAADQVVDKAADKAADAVADKATGQPADKAADTAAGNAPAPQQATPAAEAAAEAPADKPAAPEAAPAPAEGPDEETLARQRAAAMVDQEMSTGPAAKPAAKPAAAAPAKPESKPAPAADGADKGSRAPEEQAIVDMLDQDQLRTFDGLLTKITKNLPTQMLRNYVNGPKAQEALPANARAYVLALLDKADQAKTAG